MYNVINKNIDRIFGSVDKVLDIHTYLNLMNRFRTVNVVQDTEFQSRYCVYWRLYGAGLSQSFRASYFELMEELRGRPVPYIGEVIRPLYEVPSNKSGKKTLQFSFASKLLHTLAPHKPIYDSHVKTFYRFSAPHSMGSFESRLQSLLTFYDFLRAEYEKILEDGLLQELIFRFRRVFSVPDQYTDEKIIDTFIWRTVYLYKKGDL